MKKIKTILFCCVLSFTTFSQTSLSTAVDFTVTDIHGSTHNLFDILNGGQYVLLDFFFTTCGPCISSAPEYSQAYQDYGCNSADVYFLSIDNGDSDMEVLSYESSYMGFNPPPAVSGIEGGGNSVVSVYGIGAYPTFILINPNKQIVIQDLWPFSYSILENELTNYGINKAPCSTFIHDNLEIEGSVFPNPARNFITLDFPGSLNVSVLNLLGEKIYQVNLDKNKKINIKDFNKGTYFIEVNFENKVVRKKILIQ